VRSSCRPSHEPPLVKLRDLDTTPRQPDRIKRVEVADVVDFRFRTRFFRFSDNHIFQIFIPSISSRTCSIRKYVSRILRELGLYIHQQVRCRRYHLLPFQHTHVYIGQRPFSVLTSSRFSFAVRTFRSRTNTRTNNRTKRLAFRTVYYIV